MGVNIPFSIENLSSITKNFLTFSIFERLVFIFLISKEELANKEWWEESYFSYHIIEISKLIEEYDVPEKIKGVKFPLQENLDSINKKIQ